MTVETPRDAALTSHLVQVVSYKDRMGLSASRTITNQPRFLMARLSTSRAEDITELWPFTPRSLSRDRVSLSHCFPPRSLGVPRLHRSLCCVPAFSSVAVCSCEYCTSPETSVTCNCRHHTASISSPTRLIIIQNKIRA